MVARAPGFPRRSPRSRGRSSPARTDADAAGQRRRACESSRCQPPLFGRLVHDDRSSWLPPPQSPRSNVMSSSSGDCAILAILRCDRTSPGAPSGADLHDLPPRQIDDLLPWRRMRTHSPSDALHRPWHLYDELARASQGRRAFFRKNATVERRWSSRLCSAIGEAGDVKRGAERYSTARDACSPRRVSRLAFSSRSHRLHVRLRFLAPGSEAGKSGGRPTRRNSRRCGHEKAHRARVGRPAPGRLRGLSRASSASRWCLCRATGGRRCPRPWCVVGMARRMASRMA